MRFLLFLIQHTLLPVRYQSEELVTWTIIHNYHHTHFLHRFPWSPHAAPQYRGSWISSRNGPRRCVIQLASFVESHIFMHYIVATKCCWGGSGTYHFKDDVSGARAARIVDNGWKQFGGKKSFQGPLFCVIQVSCDNFLANPLLEQKIIQNKNCKLVLRISPSCDG